MKKNLLYAALIGLFSLSACSQFKKSGSSQKNGTAMTTDTITDKKWILVELAGKPVAEKINDKEPFLLLQTADNRYAASGGCNGLGGSFTLTAPNKIKFTQGMSTMMACEDMTIESGITKALLAADHYTSDGKTLSLHQAKMAPLAKFKAADVAVNTHALNGTWEVNYVSGSRIAFDGLYPGKKPTITFNLPAAKASGNSSCNNYNIAFTITGNSIKFAEPMSTRMACEGDGEGVFFKTLKTVSQYSVNGTTLNLIMGDIAVMRLEKK